MVQRRPFLDEAVDQLLMESYRSLDVVFKVCVIMLDNYFGLKDKNVLLYSKAPYNTFDI